MIGGPYVGFLVGGVVPLAVEARRVRAVVRREGIIPVPFARLCVEGVVVREGRLIPVFDMSRIPTLWNEVPPPGGDQVIVVGGAETEVGFLAGGAETFPGEAAGRVGDGEAAKPPSAVREGILSGTRSAGGRTYGVLLVEPALRAAEVPAA